MNESPLTTSTSAVAEPGIASAACDPRYAVLDIAAAHAHEYVADLPERPVGSRASIGDLRATLGRPLAEAGTDPLTVIDDLVRDAEPGLIASGGPRYFGFVVGGALPVAVAADWLVSAWDQNCCGYTLSPALSVAEETAAGWVRDILGLPARSSIGFVTGGQMANFTCLAAARNAVLMDAGWDVEAHGLEGAPPVRVYAGEQVHMTVKVACRMLGLGSERVRMVAADEQGRMCPAALDIALAEYDGPSIVCTQAGEINTGACDRFAKIVDVCRRNRAWCHIDGAFGLWAAVSPARRHLLEGYERADSWATDAHKWLNVPYDCGIAAVSDRRAHRAAMAPSTVPFIPSHGDDVPWGYDWTPELSRRARGVPVYAALRALGRAGVQAMIDGCCDHARRMADRLSQVDGIEVVNDVTLNQVLVRFADDDAATAAVIAAVQRDGTCWLGASSFGGRGVMRVSFVGWQTMAEDVDRSADAIIAAAADCTQGDAPYPLGSVPG
ncbi:MAG TPA: pyridoxal-dependent decarboxylase [Solirubrobacteraceae bacterium]|nr:pyridoxal-dependent decarboxylase [Solirubrobacteraceae bacterium]